MRVSLVSQRREPQPSDEHYSDWTGYLVPKKTPNGIDVETKMVLMSVDIGYI